MKAIITILLIAYSLHAGAQEKIERVYIADSYCAGPLSHRPSPPPAQFLSIKPFLDVNQPNRHILVREELQHLPYTSIRDMASVFPGIYQRQRGNELNILGGRADNNRYIIDGMWCH